MVVLIVPIVVVVVVCEPTSQRLDVRLQILDLLREVRLQVLPDLVHLPLEIRLERLLDPLSCRRRNGLLGCRRLGPTVAVGAMAKLTAAKRQLLLLLLLSLQLELKSNPDLLLLLNPGGEKLFSQFVDVLVKLIPEILLDPGFLGLEFPGKAVLVA